MEDKATRRKDAKATGGAEKGKPLIVNASASLELYSTCLTIL